LAPPLKSDWQTGDKKVHEIKKACKCKVLARNPIRFALTGFFAKIEKHDSHRQFLI